ncbi:hypothetical protein CHUAL_002118 [Chamberlinius hualienensis]
METGSKSGGTMVTVLKSGSGVICNSSNSCRVSMVETTTDVTVDDDDMDGINLNRQSWNGICFDEGSSASVDDDISLTRGQSPNPDSHMSQISMNRSSGARGSRNNLQVPSENYGGGTRSSGSHRSKGFLGFCETLFEEECDLIKSCGALSTVLGLRRSFSTSDIISPVINSELDLILRSSTSEMMLGTIGLSSSLEAAVASGRNDILTTATHGRLDYTSRSCSTWVAVGDMASTSQLPSPQGQPASTQLSSEAPTISATELIRSVNKKVRQTYIKRRLLTTYKALEREAQSELQMNSMLGANKVSKSQISREILKLLKKDFDPQGQQLELVKAVKSITLTVIDVEREKGKPLTKYERNMMIFNWLHSLDESTPYDKLN